VREMCGFGLREARNSGYCPIDHLRQNHTRVCTTFRPMINVRSLLSINGPEFCPKVPAVKLSFWGEDSRTMAPQSPT
jgi:hypothetical protein